MNIHIIVHRTLTEMRLSNVSLVHVSLYLHNVTLLVKMKFDAINDLTVYNLQVTKIT